MRNLISLFLILFTLSACKNEPKQAELKPLVDIQSITAEYMDWWTYQSESIALSQDFKALDQDAEEISKEEFLQALTTGKYVPIEMKSTGTTVYKLYILPAEVDKEISSTIKDITAEIYALYKMEGQDFPEFEVKDLKGNLYNNESFKGKTSLIKTWFINCKPCINEMPELNEMLASYKDEEQLQFLSLALDNAEALEKFLEKIEFNYPVIAAQKDLIWNKLGLNSYPTHIVVDGDGKIQKILKRSSDLKAYVEKLYPNSGTTTTVAPKKEHVPPPPPSPSA